MTDLEPQAVTFTQDGRLSPDHSDQEMVRRLTALSYDVRNLMDVGELATLLRRVRAGVVVLPGRDCAESGRLVVAAQSKVLARSRALRRDRALKWLLFACGACVVALTPWLLPHLAALLVG